MKTLKKIFLASMWVLLLTACDKEDLTPRIDNKLVANAGTDREMPLGSPVQVDGSGSRDGNNKPFTYHWTMKTKPAGSSATLTVPTEEKSVFTPDQLGIYEIELKIQNESGESKALVKITAVPASAPVAVILNQDILQDRVLEDIIDDPLLPDYIVTADIGVKAKLTIMPGVVIAFEEKKGMVVNNSGALIAQGTADKKIIFTGKQAVKGYWSGLVFGNKNPANELLHAEVNYAGSNVIYTIPQATSVGVSELGYVKMTHTTIQHGKGNGLMVRNMGSIDFGQNIFRHNDGINISLPVREAHKLDSETEIVAQDASVNYVELLGDDLESENELVWKKLSNNVSYNIKENLVVRSALKIEKGVRIAVSPDKFIRIFGNGSLYAKGSIEEQIIFDVLSGGEARWGGLVVSSSSTSNRLEWVELNNAGNGQEGYGVDKSAAIGISNTVGHQIHLKHVKIQGSDGYGVYVHPAGMIGEFDHLTFSGIKNYVMALPISGVGNLQGKNIQTSNNLKNSVEIFEGNMILESVWSPLGGQVKYYLPKGMQILKGLKLEPGVKLELGSNAFLDVRSDGYLQAIGTVNDRIEIKGATDQAGFWQGILIKTKSIKNTFRYVDVSGGGSKAMGGFVNGSILTNIAVFPSGHLTMTHSNISKGAGWAVAVESKFGATINADVETANTYETVGLGNVLRIQ
ncbi:MAG TPA: hypothetical protein VK921_17015 [Anditalea sp.]|nr:hypothetical protein [Anditalea sp.]